MVTSRLVTVCRVQPNNSLSLHLDRHEWLPAQKKFERIVQQEESLNDIYSLVALGNMYYAAKFEKKDKAERYSFFLLSHSREDT